MEFLVLSPLPTALPDSYPPLPTAHFTRSQPLPQTDRPNSLGLIFSSAPLSAGSPSSGSPLLQPGSAVEALIAFVEGLHGMAVSSGSFPRQSDKQARCGCV